MDTLKMENPTLQQDMVKQSEENKYQLNEENPFSMFMRQEEQKKNSGRLSSSSSDGDVTEAPISVVENATTKSSSKKGIKSVFKKDKEEKVRQEKVENKEENKQENEQGNQQVKTANLSKYITDKLIKEQDDRNKGINKERKTVAYITKEDALNNESQIISIKMQKCLFDSVIQNQQIEGASKNYKKIMSAIEDYSKMDLWETSYEELSSKLAVAKELLKDFEKNNSKFSRQEKVILNEYLEYFKNHFDGTLKDRENVHDRHIDATQRKLHLQNGQKWVDVSKQPLFVKEPTIDDVKQLGLGDCYLQGAMVSIIEQDPAALRKMMRDNGDGTVTVRFITERPEKIADLRGDLKWIYLVDAKKDKNGNVVDKKAMAKLSVSDILTKIYLTNKKIEIPDAEIANMLFPEMKSSARIANAGNAKDVFEQLVQKPEFADVVKDIEKVKNKDAATFDECINAVTNALSKSKLDVNKFGKEAEQLQLDGEAAKAPCEMYVTVKKEIPRKGLLKKTDAHTKNNLWLQMIEKAYAASGLHRLDIEGIANKNKLDINKKGVSEKIVKDYRYSYERIEGGYSFDTVSLATGRKARMITRKQASFHNVGEMLMTGAFRHLITESYNADDEKFYAIWCSGVSALCRRHDKNSIATVEDIDELMEHALDDVEVLYFVQESLKNLDINEIKKKANKCRTETINQIKEQIKTAKKEKRIEYNMPDYLSYRAFPGENEKTQYSRKLENDFKRFQRLLNEKTIINFGTRELSNEKTGRNGESEAEGMAGPHAYTLLGCVEDDNHKYFIVRNPWADGQVQYVKTNHDGQDEIKGIRAYGETGTFLIELNHFAKTVEHVYINYDPNKKLNEKETKKLSTYQF